MDDKSSRHPRSSTIAARGNNNTGVVGVNWTAKIMALKFLGPMVAELIPMPSGPYNMPPKWVRGSRTTVGEVEVTVELQCMMPLRPQVQPTLCSLPPPVILQATTMHSLTWLTLRLMTWIILYQLLQLMP